MAGRKTIKLLLTENIDNLGIIGDIVEVKPGYARNYLLPMGLAADPTPSAIKAVEARRAEVEKAMREKRDQQERLLERLTGTEITLERSANEEGMLYGSVTQHDIAKSLRNEGFAINERDIRIGSPIKRLDSYEIPVQIAADLKTEIKLWIVSDKPLGDDQNEDAPDAPEGENSDQSDQEDPTDAYDQE